MLGVGNPGLSPLVGRGIGTALLLASVVALTSRNIVIFQPLRRRLA
jgi:hypothetical protein